MTKHTKQDLQDIARWLQTSKSSANKRRVRLDGWYVRIGDHGGVSLVAQLSHKGQGCIEREHYTVDCAI